MTRKNKEAVVNRAGHYVDIESVIVRAFARGAPRAH